MLWTTEPRTYCLVKSSCDCLHLVCTWLRLSIVNHRLRRGSWRPTLPTALLVPDGFCEHSRLLWIFPHLWLHRWSWLKSVSHRNTWIRKRDLGSGKEITGMYKNQECVGVKAVNILHACLKSSKTKHIGRAFRNKDRRYPVKWGSLHTPLTNRFSFYCFYYCQ